MSSASRGTRERTDRGTSCSNASRIGPGGVSSPGKGDDAQPTTATEPNTSSSGIKERDRPGAQALETLDISLGAVRQMVEEVVGQGRRSSRTHPRSVISPLGSGGALFRRVAAPANAPSA